MIQTRLNEFKCYIRVNVVQDLLTRNLSVYETHTTYRNMRAPTRLHVYKKLTGEPGEDNKPRKLQTKCGALNRISGC